MLELNKYRQTTVAVAVGSDRIMKLLLAETLPKDAIVHSLRTRRAGANRRTVGGKTIVTDVNFDAAMLTLKKQQEDVVETLPFEHIEKASNVTPEIGYPIQLTSIDWNTSFIEVVEGVALNTGNYFELTIVFSLPNK